jgi:hypothetical protein
MTDEKAPDFLTLEIKDMGESWGIIHAMPRDFNSGRKGYYGVGKIINTGNPRARYQVNVNITLIGSKLRE